MKTVIRCAALIVAISLIASCLFSCEIIFGTDPTEAVNGAEAALKSAPYTVDMGILFESKDEEMQAVIDSFASPLIKLKADLLGQERILYMNYQLIGDDGAPIDPVTEMLGDPEDEWLTAWTPDFSEDLAEDLDREAQLRWEEENRTETEEEPPEDGP